MPTGAVLLVLASALVHATWNALLKRSARPEDVAPGMAVACAVSALLVALPFGIDLSSARFVAWSAAAGVLEAAYFVTLAKAFARAPLGAVYTISRGGALVVVWPISMVFLHEQMTAARAIGTALVLLGLVATGLATPRVTRADNSEASGLLLAGVTALFIGGYHLCYKMGLSAGGSPTSANAISLGTAACVNVAWLGRLRRARVWEAVRAQPAVTALTGFLGAVGFVLFLGAMAQTGAGLVLTLRNSSILFTQAIAFALGERPRPIALVGTAFVTAGAVLLTL